MAPAAVLLALALIPLLGATAAPLRWRNDIPPRLQWNENSGYCGEVCFLSAGLYYGQYLSQCDARATIGRHVRQNRSELLLGVNDHRAATRMHLKIVAWNPSRQARPPAQFLDWIERQVRRGRPVAIGLYNNESRLYGNPDPAAGDPTYDHIVPVIGAGGGTLLFSDNGLWGTGPARRYFFRARFARFPADRAAANAPGGPIYSLPADGPNYGVAFTGVVDPRGETLPVRLTTNRNSERPSIRPASNRRPPGRPLALTITVSGLQPGVAYRLYRYDALDAVPDSDFNARAAQAAQNWTIQISSGTSYTFDQTIDSNDVAIYRAVRAD